LGFWLGVVLMALSFGIYPVYPWVAFLPMSWLDKVGVAAGLAAISWSMFLVGSLFAGKKGLAYLKQRFSSWRVSQGLPVGRSDPKSRSSGRSRVSAPHPVGATTVTARI
jgi:hypothetical protein